MPQDDSNALTPGSSSIQAAPTKNFFVNILTRDIELEDAILDLLDNCTDGILRTLKKRGKDIESYIGFRADITVEHNHFKISDNCGGITIKHARDFAFRMGRESNENIEEDNLYTIGTYGIGMKRAMFKMGRQCKVASQTEDEAFRVDINPDWFKNDSWSLPLQEIEKTGDENGTTIEVRNLTPDVERKFQSTSFASSLINKIAQLYTYIIRKGFSIRVNNRLVDPKTLQLRMVKTLRVDEPEIIPYVYRGSFDDVEVSLAIGFYRPIPTETELAQEREGKRNSSADAGWTVVCNDRIVLYCDKSIQTGWGAQGVPNYHTQFISIAGFVYFRSTNVDRLPLTTTKRGVDFNSALYLQVRERMIEGLKYFTGFTNKWKTNLLESKRLIEDTQSFEPEVVIEHVARELGPSWKRVQSNETQKRFVPALPFPKKAAVQEKRIVYKRPIKEIGILSSYLFDDPNRDPNEVGETAFETLLDRARE